MYCYVYANLGYEALVEVVLFTYSCSPWADSKKKSLITCILVNKNMMMSSNGNIFHITGPLCGEFTGHRWIPLTRDSGAKLWYFLWLHSPLTHKSEQNGCNCVDSVQCIFESVVYIDSNVSNIFAKDFIQNKSALDQLMACDQKATIFVWKKGDPVH